MANQKIVRTSMNLPEESIETLRELAQKTGSSMAEVVRRAVATEKFLRDTAAEGSKILIKDKDSGMLRELLIR
ncbi:MAG: ribbon-helix-helix protein, CopG family [Acidobacteriaceae bacterium]